MPTRKQWGEALGEGAHSGDLGCPVEGCGRVLRMWRLRQNPSREVACQMQGFAEASGWWLPEQSGFWVPGFTTGSHSSFPEVCLEVAANTDIDSISCDIGTIP